VGLTNTCVGCGVDAGVGRGCGGGEDRGVCAAAARTEEKTNANETISRMILRHLLIDLYCF
jgi:hypothetical protein